MENKSVSLPHSIWEAILESATLSAADVASVCSTCKSLYSLLPSQQVWRTKFAQRWPSLFKEINLTVPDWRDVFRLRKCTTASTVSEILKNLSTQHTYYDTELPEFARVLFTEFADSSELHHLFLIDELRFILLNLPSDVCLTDKLYADVAFRFVVKCNLTEPWRQWFSGNQLLEDGALLLSQWLLPKTVHDFDGVKHFLDDMADETRQLLADSNKRHPLVNRTEPINYEELRQSLWSPTESSEIIDALNFVFVRRRRFKGNAEHDDVKKSWLLNEVIASRRGSPVTLCVLYQAVAARLGVSCAPVDLPAHFLLKFMDRPMSSQNQSYTYVDVSAGCIYMREEQVVWKYGRIEPDTDDSSTRITAIMRMVHGILDCRYQLSADLFNDHLKPAASVNFDEFITQLTFARCYLYLDTEPVDLLTLFDNDYDDYDYYYGSSRDYDKYW